MTIHRPRLTEQALQCAIVAYAEVLGWRVYHPWLSFTSARGYPDLTLTWRGRLVITELKSATGKLSEAQADWLTDLRSVPGIEVFEWRPEDCLPGASRRCCGDASATRGGWWEWTK